MPTLKKGNWVAHLDRGFRWTPLQSSNERRLFYEYSGEITIKGVGRHTPGIFAFINRVGFINMTPQRLELELPHVVSRDGVALRTTAASVLVVQERDDAMRRVALDPDAEEQLAADIILAGVQSAFAAHRYEELLGRPSNVSQAVMEAFESNATSPIFALHHFTLLDLQPIDAELAKVRLDRARALEEAALELVKEQHSIDRMKLAKEAEKFRMQADLEMLRLRSETELRVEQIQAELGTEMQMKKLEVQKEMAKLTALPGGEKVVFTEQAYRVEIEKIKAMHQWMKFWQGVNRAMIGVAFKGGLNHGQLDAMRSMMQRHFNLSLKELGADEITDEILGAEPTGQLPDEAAGVTEEGETT